MTMPKEFNLYLTDLENHLLQRRLTEARGHEWVKATLQDPMEAENYGFELSGSPRQRAQDWAWSAGYEASKQGLPAKVPTKSRDGAWQALLAFAKSEGFAPALKKEWLDGYSTASS